MFKRLGVCLSISLLSLSAFAQEYWLDVRIPEQFERQHIDGAINLPLANIQSTIADVVKDKNDTVYLYCNTGRQSNIAFNALKEMGYVNVHDEGGINNALAKWPDKKAITKE